MQNALMEALGATEEELDLNTESIKTIYDACPSSLSSLPLPCRISTFLCSSAMLSWRGSRSCSRPRRPTRLLPLSWPSPIFTSSAPSPLPFPFLFC